MTTATATTVGELFAAAVAEYEHEPALQTPDGSVAWTWGEYGRQAAAAAAGLAGLGVERGSVVACWLTNRPEFHAADMGAALLGAASFSIYPTYTAEQAAHVLWDAGSKVLITEPAFLERALAVRASGATALETIVCVGEATRRNGGWDGPARSASDDGDLDALAGAPQAGRPADDHLHVGHDRAAEGRRAHPRKRPRTARGDERRARADRPDARHLLPADGAHRRAPGHALPADRPRLARHDLRRRRGRSGRCCPRSAPRCSSRRRGMWEKMRAARSPGSARTPTARPRLRRSASMQVRVAITGAAPCPAEVIEFWGALGLPCARSTGCPRRPASRPSTRRGALRPGTVGVRAAGRRGGAVGHRRDPHARAGDHARLPQPPRRDRRGDRRRRLDALRRRRRDRRRRLPADRRPHQGADHQRRRQEHVPGEHRGDDQGRRVADRQRLRDRRRASPTTSRSSRWTPTRAAHASTTRRPPRSRRRSQRANERLARVEQIKRFTVLPHDWVADGDELTPTSKLKRRAIAAKYATEIEGMYA